MTDIDRDLVPAPRAAGLEARVKSAIGDVRPVTPLWPPLARSAIAAFLGLVLVAALAHPIADAEPRRASAFAFVVLAALGLWIAMRLAVPGDGRARVPGIFWLAIPMLFAVWVLAQFGTIGGVHGVECLVLGAGIAFLPLVTACALVARGYSMRPALTGAIAGVSAGSFGLALLTLNCPVLEGPHLAIFHGSVLVLSLAVGALASVVVRRT